MSRQRIHPSIEFGSHIVCRQCQGKGLIPTTETLGIGFLRKLGMEAIKNDVTRVKCVVPTAVAEFLLNKKRRDIVEFETRRNLTIDIEGDAGLTPGESRIVCSS
jgi:ribonuclease E